MYALFHMFLKRPVGQIGVFPGLIVAPSSLFNSTVGASNLSGFKLWEFSAHHGGLVIAVKDVDEICNSQHTCGRGGFTFPLLPVSEPSLPYLSH